MSVLGPMAGRSGRVARGEFHRTLRSIRETPREAVGVVTLAILTGLFTLAGIVGAYVVGRSFRTDAALFEWAVLPVARALVGIVWIALVVVVAFRTLATVAHLEQGDLLLSTVSVRDLVFGKVLAEAASLACWVLPPLVAVSAAFAVGANDPTVAPAFVTAALVVVGAAVAVGFVLGIVLRHVATRYEPVVRVKTPLAIVLVVGYVAFIVSGRLDVVFSLLYEPIQYWPVAWLADLLFLPLSDVGASVRTAAFGLGFTVAVTVGALTVAPRVAALHWLSDPPQTGPRAPSSTHSRAHSTRSASSATAARTLRVPSQLERLLTPITTRQTRVVAVVVWRRTVRSPIRLLYLVYPLFFVVEPARQTLESLRATGTVPEWILPLVVAYVIWASGMAFTLNALGDQGATLPATLATPASARAVVGGRVLVGVLTALPVAVVLVGSLALASPLAPTAVLGLVLATSGGVVAAVALATGIGVAFPRFGAVSVTRNRSVVVPGKAAAVSYSLVVLALAGCLSLVAYEPAWEPIALALSVLVSGVAPVSADVSVSALRATGVAVLFVLAVVPLLSYRYAVSRIEDYSLE